MLDRSVNGGHEGRARDALDGPEDGRVSLDEPLFDCSRAAALLGVRVSWVRDAARSGALPCLRIGRHLRFSRSMLEAWLAEQAEQASRSAPSSAGSRVSRVRTLASRDARRRAGERALIAGLDDDSREAGQR